MSVGSLPPYDPSQAMSYQQYLEEVEEAKKKTEDPIDQAIMQNIKDQISEDLDGINQAVQYAGTPSEDQDPDAPPPGCST